MSLLALLGVLQLAIYLVLAVVSLEQWRNRRTEAAAWLAGTLLMLTALVTLGRLVQPDDTGAVVELGRRGLVCLLALFPYSLFRFTSSFSDHGRLRRRLALGSLVVVCGTALVLPALVPPTGPWPWWLAAYAAAMAIHWTALSVVSVRALWRSGRGQPTVSRRRMRLMAGAAAILNLALLMFVGSGGRHASSASPGQQTAALVSGVLFLVGFSPPAVLRTMWRRTEWEAFHAGEVDLMAAETEEGVGGIILRHAIELVGARAAVLVDESGAIRARRGVDAEGAAAIAGRLPAVAGAGQPYVLADLVAVPVRSGWLAVATSPATPLFGDEEIGLLGTLAHLAGLALDRIDLYEKERVSRQVLAEREFQLAEAQRTAQIGSYTWDPVSRNVLWSDEMYRVLGYGARAVEDHAAAFLARIHPDDREKVLAAWAAAPSATVASSDEFRIVLDDGGIRWIQGRLQPVLDGAGRRLVGTLQDITERKQAETRLREAFEREQRLVVELRELAKVKTDFISTVSHELRTPLTSIAGYVELLADGSVGPLSGSQLDVLQVVDRNSRRLMSLIEDLLTLSSVDSDGFALSVAPLDVVALVEGVHRAVLPSAASHGISLTVDVDPHAGILVADASQLDRALLNLLSNAIKFTPEGGQVSVRIRRDGRDRITFTVSDTGIGIPLDEQEQLFSRFFRSSTATERAIPGSGLGLAIVKTIVEEHGGTIAVESVPSIGTTVTFALPASAAPADRGRRVQRAVR